MSPLPITILGHSTDFCWNCPTLLSSVTVLLLDVGRGDAALQITIEKTALTCFCRSVFSPEIAASVVLEGLGRDLPVPLGIGWGVILSYWYHPRDKVENPGAWACGYGIQLGEGLSSPFQEAGGQCLPGTP